MGENNTIWIPKQKLKDADIVDYSILTELYYKTYTLRWWQVKKAYGFNGLAIIRNIDYTTAVKQICSLKKKDSLTKIGKDILDVLQNRLY